MLRSLSPLARGVCGLVALALPIGEAAAQDVPPGYQQILPRGGIASIDAPDWVSVGEAEIPDDAWVFGVVIDNQARAFAITVLNHHEIVNDKIGDTAYAAVW